MNRILRSCMGFLLNGWTSSICAMKQSHRVVSCWLQSHGNGVRGNREWCPSLSSDVDYTYLIIILQLYDYLGVKQIYMHTYMLTYLHSSIHIYRNTSILIYIGYIHLFTSRPIFSVALCSPLSYILMWETTRQWVGVYFYRNEMLSSRTWGPEGLIWTLNLRQLYSMGKFAEPIVYLNYFSSA